MIFKLIHNFILLILFVRQFCDNNNNYVNNNKMVQFVYWYAYFDCMFAKKKSISNKTLAYIIQSESQQFAEGLLLPQLRECFEDIKSFILQGKNWSESICTIDELNKIEADVNYVLQLLEVENMYIKKFWGSYRRIEASVAHLYALLQIFISSIIPYNTMTLFQCKAANKLCIKIVNLQELIKNLMKKMNVICAFFSSDFFQQQYEILKNFFQNFVEYMKSIPKIKKVRMFHISQLLKYIMLVNTIQIASFQQNIQFQNSTHNNQFKQKAEIQVQNIQKQTKSCSQKIKKYKYFQINTSNKEIWKISNSCPKYTNQNNEVEEKPKKQFRFNFPSWIRRHSIKHRKESIPKLHLQYSFKVKSNTQIQKPVFTPQDDKKNKYRNKSVTKLSLSKSHTQQDGGITPSRVHNIKHSFQIQKIKNQESMLEDNQENCIATESQTFIYIEQQILRKKAKIELQKMFSLQKMQIQPQNKNQFIEIQRKIEEFSLKKLQDILKQ